MAKAKKALEILEEAIQPRNLPPANLSLGDPLLNLCVTGDYRYGIGPGKYMFYCGASSSGKTFITLTMLAEAARMPEYDDYEFWLIDQEHGANMDMARYFGKKMANRLQTITFETLEQMYDWHTAKQKAGTKSIVILDSFDSLKSEKRHAKQDEQAKQREQGKDVSGTFGMDEPKLHSARLPDLVADVARTGSIFVGISQIRDNPDAGLYGPKTTRSGGHAVKFYATLEIHTTCGAKLTKEINGKKRAWGVKSHVKVLKNRVNGKERQADLIFVPDVGIDSVGTAVEFLIEEKAWAATGGRIACPMYPDKAYYKEALIQKIEADGREDELYSAMQDCWDSIEEQLKVERKSKYNDE